MKHTILKDVKLAVVLGLLLTGLLSAVRLDANCAQVRGSLLRLHVLANSDSEADQALKLKVRDKLLTYADTLFAECSTEDEALSVAADHLQTLQQVATEEVRAQGYSYPVTVTVGKAYFDTRVYPEFTLPAGEYDALRVMIGKAEGKNWWCVLFPPVCLPAAQANISESLSAENTDFVQNPQVPKYKIAFKTVEIFEDFKQFLKKYATS